MSSNSTASKQTTMGRFGAWLANGHPLARINRFPVIVLALLVGMFLLTEAARHREYTLIKTVGLDTAPSVESAHNIKAGIARMSEDLFSEIAAQPGENYDLVKDFELNRQMVDGALVAAARNITYTDDALKLHPSEQQGEVGPVNRLQEGYAQFLQLAAKARVFHENGDAAALAVSREIATLVLTKLLPAADALAMVNDAHNQAEYASRSEHFKTAVFGIFGLGGAILLYMFYVQFWVMPKTFHRTLNPLYLSASAVAVAFMLYAGNAFLQADKHLSIAGTDAYPSIKVLAETRANLLQMKAEQAAWLLDRPNADAHQKSFGELMARVGAFPRGINSDRIVTEAFKAYKADGEGYRKMSDGDAISKNLFTGTLADELNNITFAGELDAALKTVKAYNDFLALDAKIRALETQGQHAKAVSLMAGGNAGQGTYVFEQLVDESETKGTLGTVLRINREHLTSNVEKAFNDIELLTWGTPVALFVVQLLIFFGTLLTRASASPARAAAQWRKLNGHA